MRHLSLIALIFLSSLSTAYVFDSNSPFGQCFVKYCTAGDKSCSASLCDPIYSGCAIPCGPIYSNVGSACEEMCNFAAGKSDSCTQAYISAATGCFPGCVSAEWSGSCADDCEDNAMEKYEACSKKATATTRATTTTRATSSGCNNNGVCETARQENCNNCGNDCGCDDLLCSPGTSGANSWGCFDPCLAVDHSYYDPSSENCVCDNGYIVNDAGDGCISADRCPEHSVRSGSECSCVEGYFDCNKKFDDGCEENVENDDFNCGGCGLQCPAGSHCKDMKCLCESGLMDCDQSSGNGCESDPQTDELNCGECGTVCPEGGECRGGICQCPEGYVLDLNNRCVFLCDNDGTCDPSLGESCKSCGDCACKGKDVCDQFSDFVDKTNGCSPPVAYIMVSPDLTSYEGWWISPKINHIRNFYLAQGYRIVYIDQSGSVGFSPKSRVMKGDIKYEKDQKVLDAGINRFLLGMSNPSTKAVAYFGHGGMPSIEYTAAQNIPNDIKKLRYTRDLASGMSKDEAKAESEGASSLGSLDYAYIHTCHSLDDTSLADTLLKSGGTFWGKAGTLYATGSTTKYVKQ